MSSLETVGAVCAAVEKKSSNVITSFLEPLAGSMYRAIAECFACCAMTRYTGAEDGSGSTISV